LLTGWLFVLICNAIGTQKIGTVTKRDSVRRVLVVDERMEQVVDKKTRLFHYEEVEGEHRQSI
jgi:hypothetical protein